MVILVICVIVLIIIVINLIIINSTLKRKLKAKITKNKNEGLSNLRDFLKEW